MRKRIPNPAHAIRDLLKNYILAIIITGAIALSLRSFVIEAFRLPSDFMSPTLIAGDHIFLNKLTYKFNSVARGDVVVFGFPNEPGKDYIKRVIGIGDDLIEIKDSQIFLNNQPVDEKISEDHFKETLDAHQFDVLWTDAAPSSRKLIQIKVPKGSVFLLGDHRAKGQDSRSWGFVPESAIKGKVFLIWFSKDSSGVHWERIFKSVR